jgi:CHAT domain-containing protein
MNYRKAARIFQKKCFLLRTLGWITLLTSLGSLAAPAKANNSVNENRLCDVLSIRPNESIQFSEPLIENISLVENSFNIANAGERIILSYEISEPSLYHNEVHPDFRVFRDGIDAIIAPYLGQAVSPARLKAIQDEITLLYLRDGYVTSRAESLSIQDDGTLVIDIVEGFICEVRVGTQNIPFSTAQTTQLGRRIFDRLESVLQNPDGSPAQPVNFSQLERRIQSLAQNQQFEPGQTISGLQVPTENFLDRYNRYVEYIRLSSPNEQIRQERILSGLQALLDSDRSDIAVSGASILEIGVEFREVVENPDGRVSEARFDASIPAIENRRLNEFGDYFGQEFDRQLVDPASIRFALHSLEVQEPAIRAAVVYIDSDEERVFTRVETAQGRRIEIENITQFDREIPEDEFEFSEDSGQAEPKPDDEDESEEDDPSSTTVERDELVLEVENFWREIQKPNSDNYLQYSERLYDLLIRPVEVELEAQDIEVNTLLFVMENGLRLLPVTALYDSKTGEYLAEKYNIGVIPNFRSLDLRPADLARADILALGVSEFGESDLYPPLSAVPLELELINRIWRNSAGRSQTFLNEESTLANLRRERREHPFQIVHLATHASFRRGEPGDSSIQLWDTTLPLNELQVATLNWNKPPVDLLVLSACQTALGDEDAELGFAGLSLQSEVKSILASLWYVNDLASVIYMTEFYRNLKSGVTKAEAVRNTQMAMLNEQRLTQNLREIEIVINALLAENRRLDSLTETEEQGLRRMLSQLNDSEIAERLTHPFYWSAYTLIGSPW